MRASHSDTDPEAERALVEAIRRAPVWRRVALASELTRATRALALADLRRQSPGASEEELRHRLARRLLTPDEIGAASGPES
jgi:hypothetical protein